MEMFTFNALALLILALCVQPTVQQLYCDAQTCGILTGRQCCNYYHCSNLLSGSCIANGCSWEYGYCAADAPKKDCCPGFTCSNIFGGECAPNVNECRPEHVSCLSSPDAAFYAKCCYPLVCLDSNGQTGNNGTCKVDPTATTTPLPCSALHDQCIFGRIGHCCGDAQCTNETTIEGNPIPGLTFGICRNENETAPYCGGDEQSCAVNACCSEFHCDLEELKCKDEKPKCRDDEETCEKDTCCTGLQCVIAMGQRIGRCFDNPTCGLENQPCLNGTCCTGFICEFGNSENVGQCAPLKGTSTTVNVPETVDPTTTAVTTTTMTLATTTTSQGTCTAQGNFCLLDLLINTCCPGLKCTGLLVGTCKPI